MTVVLDTRDDFTLANFRRVCYGGEAVQLGAQARRALAALASPGADRPQPGAVSARRACSPSRTASPP